MSKTDVMKIQVGGRTLRLDLTPSNDVQSQIVSFLNSFPPNGRGNRYEVAAEMLRLGGVEVVARLEQTARDAEQLEIVRFLNALPPGERFEMLSRLLQAGAGGLRAQGAQRLQPRRG